MVVDPNREARYPNLKIELGVVYGVWRDGGKTPYDYLFKLSSDEIEVDAAVWLLGKEIEHKNNEKTWR